MILKMDIDQGDNGWILNFSGHDYIHRTVICRHWDEVVYVLGEYFGWYDGDGKHRKKNPYFFSPVSSEEDDK